jgi:hypothetical protein
MFLKYSRKVLKNILARSVIFVNFAVTTGAGSAKIPKIVRARHLSKNKCLLDKDFISTLPL